VLRERFPEGMASKFADFVAASRRGFIPERRTPSKPLKLVRVEEEEKTVSMSEAVPQTAQENQGTDGESQPMRAIG